MTLTLSEYSQAIRSIFEDMAAAFHINLEELMENEGPGLTYFSGTYSGAELPDLLEPSKVDAWFSQLKGDLSIGIAIDDHDFREHVTLADRRGLEEALSICKTYKVDDVVIECQLNKDELKETINSMSGTRVHQVFFFESGLVHSLSIPAVSRLLHNGSFVPTSHTLVAVLFSHGMLQGHFTSVVGLLDASATDFERVPPRESLSNAWGLVLSQRKHSTIWSAPLSEVCPDVFQVVSLRSGLEMAQLALTYLCDCLAIFQFCSSVTEESGVITARVSNFKGPNIEVADQSNASASASPNTLRTFPSLYSLYRWAFPSESRTKIDVVRTVIHETFPRVESVTIAQLQEKGDTLLQAAESNFAIVCRRAFKAYMQSREEVERGIQEFLRSTHLSIAALGDEVLRTSLQFFTGALAIVVANIFNQTISHTAKILGLWLALAYVFLIVIFRLVRLFRQHKIQLKESNILIDDHNELPVSMLNGYKSDLVTKSAADFNFWFVAACFFYGVCAILIVALLIALK